MYFLRARGHVSVLYLNDFILLGNTLRECAENVSQTIDLLEKLGFVFNFAKSQTVPKQRGVYLGFVFDSVHMTMSLPDRKRLKIIQIIKGIRSRGRCKIREFAQFLGVLTSSCPAVRYGWLYTKLFEREKFLALQNSSGCLQR